MQQVKMTVFIVATAAIAAMSGCQQGGGQETAEPPRRTTPEADFSGVVPVGWPLCKPFVDGNYETVRGFLVVETVKDHPNLHASGVETGDICLSWATRDPEVPETLRDAWLGFLKWGRGDEDVCWFARDNGGGIEVFACEAGMLYECMASLGTFGLALRPTAFSHEDVERIRAAAEARRKSDPEEQAEGHAPLPSLRESPMLFEYSFKTDDGEWRGRVDRMGEGRWRLALWRRGRSLSEPPDIVSDAAWRPDGTGGNGWYDPVGSESGRNGFRLFETNLGTDDTPPLVLEMQTPDGGVTRHTAQRALLRFP